MPHPAVCLETQIVIEEASLDEVVSFIIETLKGMKLKTEKEESSEKGKTVIFGKEGGLVPLVLKTLLYPFSLNEYVRSAQRSGVHVAVASHEDAVHVYSCGIALDETSGRLEKYSKDEVYSEVTDTIEAWSFEEKFIKRLLDHFPKARQIR